MRIQVHVHSPESSRAREWGRALEALLEARFEAKFAYGDPGDGGDSRVVVLDGEDPGLSRRLGRIPRAGRAVFLVCGESSPEALAHLDARAVDGVLTAPFRAAEVVQAFLGVSRLLLWDEVGRLNASIAEVLEELKGDLELAERLQKAQSPKRFPKVKGIHVSSRYLAGERPGGDFFDLAEGLEGQCLSILLSDASSYGLSSAVLGTIMKVAARLSADETRSCAETVRRIQAELRATLREGDRHSLFYGIYSRRDHRLRYLHLGTAAAWYRGPGGAVRWLEPQGGPMSRHSQTIQVPVREVAIEPGARLILASDGLLEALGGRDPADEVLELGNPDKTMNELFYRVKKTLKQREDLPAQDCSVLILDFDAKGLRLAG